ncbi:MAG: MBL fold metallo-hydrolase [Acidobacteria bacterium]|nr:MAG: MBL fold metallo-hydrolase [Acidobacteriota bacterium]RPJ76975.1 MAG: MBL fold metallo-hydrolase [Acidobacteriota bacterium]
MIACECGTCTSADPRDQRLRPSVLVDLPGGRTLLIDAAPDLRAQALRHRIRRVDAILFTHAHADHVLGLDETRRFTALQRCAMPCYGDAETIAEIRRVFAYAFRGGQEGGGVPRLELIPVSAPFDAAGQRVVPVPVFHGELAIYGYRLGQFAYLTDCSRIPDSSWPLLEGVRVLVIDALRDVPHPTHFTLEQALEAVVRIAPDRALLTHVSHDLGHAATSSRLPPRVELAYDGLIVDIEL